MSMLCERCFTPIDDGETFVRFAHIDHIDRDGNLTCTYTYIHTTACVLPRLAPHERPDTGAWNPARGIRSRRR